MGACRSDLFTTQNVPVAFFCIIPCDGHKDPRRTGQGLPDGGGLLAKSCPLNHSINVTTSEKSSLTTSFVHHPDLSQHAVYCLHGKYYILTLSHVFVYYLFLFSWQPTPVLLPRKTHGWRSLVQATAHGIAKSRTRLSDFTSLPIRT